MRNQVQLAEPDDISDIEAAEIFVVRDVQEDAVSGQAAEARLRLFSGLSEFTGTFFPISNLCLELVHERLQLFLASSWRYGKRFSNSSRVGRGAVM